MYEVQAEPYAGWVRGLVALAAVEHHLGDPELVLVHISCTTVSKEFLPLSLLTSAMFAGGEGFHLVNSVPGLQLNLHWLDRRTGLVRLNRLLGLRIAIGVRVRVAAAVGAR